MGHKEKHHKEKHHHKDDRKQHKKTEQDRDKSKDECQSPDYHKMHMCVLKHMSQMQMFDELSVNPTHRCSRCGCSSNKAKNLCQPYEL